MTQQHGLTWGALDFVDTEPTEDGWIVEAVAEGTEFGSPAAIVETVKSLLTDGSLAVIQNWDNRTITLRIRVTAVSELAGPALAAGEAALFAEVLNEQPEPLIFTPPAEDAEPCVFDVVVATLDRDYGADFDSLEVLQEQRYYILTLTCLPFVRPQESVVVTAPAVPPPPGTSTWVDIDTCDATTGWSRELPSSGSAPTVVDGAVEIAGTTTLTGPLTMRLVRTGTISMGSTTPYLAVDVRAETVFGANSWTQNNTFATVSLWAGSATSIAPIASQGLTEGFTRYWFNLGTDVAHSLVKVTATLPLGSAAGTRSYFLRVGNVARTDTLGDATTSTSRQQSRTLTVAGSAPTQAAIRLRDETPAALGTEILIHSSRNTAWQPPLRRWRASGPAVTADTTRVSGGRNTLTTPMAFEIPASLLTEGTYSLMALMDVDVAGTLSWQARMVDSAGATTVGSSVVVSGSVSLDVTSGYEAVTLGALSLPVVMVEGDQMVEITLTGTADMTLDEGFLFGLDDGALTWLRDSDSITWVEVRSPELDSARPAVFGGTGALGENGICVDWKCESFGTHRFDAGSMQVYTMTSTSLESQADLEFHPRYHSHVA